MNKHIPTPDGQDFYRVWLAFADKEERECASFHNYKMAHNFISLAIQGMYDIQSGTIRRPNGEILRTVTTDGTWTRWE